MHPEVALQEQTTDREITFEKIQKASVILRVISHPVRLEILRLLDIYGTMDVSSLCERVCGKCEISMMSHHLAKMKDNGVLSSEKQGKQVFYSIADRQVLKILDCIKCIDKN